MLDIAIDKDRWPDAQIKLVAAHCSTHKNYHLALSNPRFEIWLVLHYKDLSGLSAIEIKDHSERDKIKRKWAHIKCAAKINSNNYVVEHIEKAIENARKLETKPDSRWPQAIGSHVYRLAEPLLKTPESRHEKKILIPDLHVKE